jgi:hypothetical protein
MAREKIALGTSIGARVLSSLQGFGFAKGQEVHELELRDEVIGQLARFVGQREAEVIVEADGLLHGFHPRPRVEATVEWTGRARGARIEESRVLHCEIVRPASCVA